MKQGWICLALLLCLGLGLTAQYIVVPPSAVPSVGTCNSWPFSGYTNWRLQCIVPASMLVNAPVKFTDIEFAPCGTGTFSATQFQMRMGHTTFKDFSTSGTTVFDNILGPCPTIVYDGPAKWAETSNTWSPFGLQAPFGYDGKRNLVIEIRYKGRSGGSSCHRDSLVPRAYTHDGYSGDPYNATNWYTPIPGEYMMLIFRLKYDKQCILLTPDSAKIGTSVPVSLGAGPPAAFYQIAASLGQRPGIPVGPCQVFLTVDPILIYSVAIGVPVFNNYAGVLSAAGGATGKFAIPLAKPLVGLCVYHAGLCFDKQGVKCCTNTDGTLITP